MPPLRLRLAAQPPPLAEEAFDKYSLWDNSQPSGKPIPTCGSGSESNRETG